MSRLPHQADAVFYTLVHQLVHQTDAPVEERRTGPRHPFACNQRIAPVRGPDLPGPDDFFEVRCRDLTSGGIAFLLPEPPDFRRFVVQLGTPPESVDLEATVLHSFEVFVWPSGRIEAVKDILAVQGHDDPPEGADRMYQVGARFSRRLSS